MYDVMFDEPSPEEMLEASEAGGRSIDLSMGANGEHSQSPDRRVHVHLHPDGWAVTRVHTSRKSTVYWSRRFAIDAGREAAERELADLVVYNEAGQVDFRVSHAKKAAGRRWSPRRRAASVDTVPQVGHLASTAEKLLEVVLPYDSWCLRTARTESTKALTGLCDTDVQDELLHVITELVMNTTVDSRSECTLLVYRIDDEVLIVVRTRYACPTKRLRDVGTIESGRDTMHTMTTEYWVERSVGQQCVWARFNLSGRSSNQE